MILKYWTTSKGVRYMHRLVCTVFECEYQMQPGYDDVSHYVARNYVRAIQTNDFIPSVLFHLCTLRHPDSLWAPAALNPASHIPPSLHRSYLCPVVVKVHRSSTWVKVQIRIIKYYSSKSKSTAFSILLEWKYKSTQFFMYLSKKVLIDRFILQFYIDYFI